MKKILSLVLAFTLLFASVISISADEIPSPKEEVVYGILDMDGNINSLYVVNIFNGGDITDFGNYKDISNMTSSEKIDRNGEQITIHTTAEKFYYQGTLEKKELPWDIAIKYYLDGKAISAAELAGKSGKLEITVSVKQNTNINRTFFDNYALQIALSLDNKLCSNITTENATIAEAGSKKQLSYTVLPGNGTDISVKADVHDFEMDAISISGIKLSLGLTVDSDIFADQLSQLVNAIKDLDNGAGDLLTGLTQLSEGMQKYIDGLKAYKNGLTQLSSGAAQLNSGAAALSAGLSELTKQNGALVNGALTIQQATFDAVNGQLKGAGLPTLTAENYSTILAAAPDLAPLKQQLDGAVQFTQGLKAYTAGVSQLGQGASDLAKGTAEFKASSSVIASSANELYNAGAQLNEGIKKLQSGLAAYKEGTGKLRKGTSGMNSEINEKIDEMIGSISGTGDKVVSFVSDKNTNIAAVQFVLKTDSIRIPEAPKVVSEKPVELSFWQKLLKLFGLA